MKRRKRINEFLPLKLKEILFCITGILILILFGSCASKPKFKGYGDLCGLVVDECNRPVKDFLILCSGHGVSYTALTNEGGIFVIQNVPSGKYQISGVKKNYCKLVKTEYSFMDRTKIFCCQINSIDAALESVSKLIIRGENKLAENVLDNLDYENNSREAAAVLFYRFYLADSKKEKTKIVTKIGKIAKQRKTDYSAFTDNLEDFIYEEN